MTVWGTQNNTLHSLCRESWMRESWISVSQVHLAVSCQIWQKKKGTVQETVSKSRHRHRYGKCWNVRCHDKLLPVAFFYLNIFSSTLHSFPWLKMLFLLRPPLAVSLLTASLSHASFSFFYFQLLSFKLYLPFCHHTISVTFCVHVSDWYRREMEENWQRDMDRE